MVSAVVPTTVILCIAIILTYYLRRRKVKRCRAREDNNAGDQTRSNIDRDKVGNINNGGYKHDSGSEDRSNHQHYARYKIDQHHSSYNPHHFYDYIDKNVHAKYAGRPRIPTPSEQDNKQANIFPAIPTNKDKGPMMMRKKNLNYELNPDVLKDLPYDYAVHDTSTNMRQDHLQMAVFPAMCHLQRMQEPDCSSDRNVGRSSPMPLSSQYYDDVIQNSQRETPYFLPLRSDTYCHCHECQRSYCSMYAQESLMKEINIAFCHHQPLPNIRHHHLAERQHHRLPYENTHLDVHKEQQHLSLDHPVCHCLQENASAKTEENVKPIVITKKTEVNINAPKKNYENI